MADHNESSAQVRDQNGSGANAAITIEDNDAAGMEAVPPNTIAFDLDVTKCKIITVEDQLIRILNTDPEGIAFTITYKTKEVGQTKGAEAIPPTFDGELPYRRRQL